MAYGWVDLSMGLGVAGEWVDLNLGLGDGCVGLK